MEKTKEETIELSVLQPEDAPRIAHLLGDPQVHRFLSGAIPFPYTLKDAEDFIALVRAEGSALRNTFAVRAGGTLAGIAGYELGRLDKSHVATIGYWYGREFWGRGIATAALRKVLEKAAADPAVRRVEATAFALNGASLRVMEKCGFVREAVLRSALCKQGTLYDEVISRWEGAETLF